jgi:hypothetical protein
MIECNCSFLLCSSAIVPAVLCGYPRSPREEAGPLKGSPVSVRLRPGVPDRRYRHACFGPRPGRMPGACPDHHDRACQSGTGRAAANPARWPALLLFRGAHRQTPSGTQLRIMLLQHRLATGESLVKMHVQFKVHSGPHRAGVAHCPALPHVVHRVKRVIYIKTDGGSRLPVRTVSGQW